MDKTESSTEKRPITTEEWEEPTEQDLTTSTTSTTSKIIFEDSESQSSPVVNKTKTEWLEELHQLADTVHDFITEKHLSWNRTQELSKLTFQNVNSLIEVRTIWEGFNQTEQAQHATNLLQMIENLSAKLNIEQQQQNSDSTMLDQKFSSILVKSVKIPHLEDTEKVAKLDFNGKVSIELPLETLNRTEDKAKNIALTVVVVNKLPSYMLSTTSGDLILNSRLISVNLGQVNESIHLKPSYKFRFM